MTDRQMQIHLSASNSVTYDNGYVYNVNIVSSLQNHIYISLKHATIPVSWYNVNSNNNIIIISLLDGTTYNLTIPVGNYTGITLASQINTLVSAVLPSFTCTFSIKTSKLTFTYSTMFFINYASSYKVLGFQKNIINSSSLNGSIYSLTSSKVIDLIPVKCVCVHLSGMNTDNKSLNAPNNYSILCSIPVSSSPMGLIIYNNETFRYNTEQNQLSQITINLLDQDGNIIEFNGIDFIMTFQFDIVYFVE
jgi:hypothetical protein